LAISALLSNEGLARPLDCRFLGHIPLRETTVLAGSRLVKVPAFVLMQEMKMGPGAETNQGLLCFNASPSPLDTAPNHWG
jgi:hypothetical protein